MSSGGPPVEATGDGAVQREKKVRGHGNFAVHTYLYLVASVACATILLSSLLVHFQQRMLRRNLLEAGETVVSFLTENLRLGIFAENASEIRAALLPVLHSSHVEAVAVFDRNKRILQSARTGRSGASFGGEWIPALPRDLLDDLGRSGGGTVPTEDKDHIVFWRPVRVAAGQATPEGLYFMDPVAADAPAELLGCVAVSVSKVALRNAVHDVVTTSVSVGGAFLLIGCLAAFLVVRGATRPLHRLVVAIQRRGIPTPGGDDLDALSDTFTKLIETLDRSFGTIDELRVGLERKVRERTAELLRSNAELQTEVRERARVQQELKEARDDLEVRVKERTSELEATHKQLLHSEKLSALGRLTASIAHELNNPLSAIVGVLDLAHAAGDESTRPLCQVGIDECERITRLIQSLRSFYRPSNHTFAWMDLNETIETVLILCGNDSARRGVRLDARFGNGIPPVRAVTDQIKQVVLNLIKNAVDATGEGGTVSVSTEVDGQTVKVRVEDTGSGIQAADLPHLFEPFYTTKTDSGGTGLGLSISHDIVLRHGGEIDVESEVGKGTRFTVSLPTQGPQNEGEQGEKGGSEGGGGPSADGKPG